MQKIHKSSKFNLLTLTYLERYGRFIYVYIHLYVKWMHRVSYHAPTESSRLMQHYGFGKLSLRDAGLWFMRFANDALDFYRLA